MKIIQLEYFLAIVKYNSFTKAAQFYILASHL